MKIYQIVEPLEVISYGFNAAASGDGDIYLEVSGGEIVIEVEQYLGGVSAIGYTHYSDIVDGKQTYTNLGDYDIEVVNKYIKENLIFVQYMDEVCEAVSKEQ